MTGLVYLTGRAIGTLACPFAGALVNGLADGLFGEPDEPIQYEPIPDPDLNPTLFVDPEPYDGPWVLDEERLREIAGTA